MQHRTKIPCERKNRMSMYTLTILGAIVGFCIAYLIRKYASPASMDLKPAGPFIDRNGHVYMVRPGFANEYLVSGAICAAAAFLFGFIRANWSK